MKLSKKDIEKLAKLAKLELSEEEKKKMPAELSAILDFVEQLKNVDTEGIKPTSQVTGLVNILRPDNIKNDGNNKEILATMPKVNAEGYLQVRAVFTPHHERPGCKSEDE